MQQPVAYYNVWRSEHRNQIAHVADLAGLAANRHAYAVLNPRTGSFGPLLASKAMDGPGASGVVAPGEPFAVAQLHPAHCSCSGGNRIVLA